MILLRQLNLIPVASGVGGEKETVKTFNLGGIVGEGWRKRMTASTK